MYGPFHPPILLLDMHTTNPFANRPERPEPFPCINVTHLTLALLCAFLWREYFMVRPSSCRGSLRVSIRRRPTLLLSVIFVYSKFCIQWGTFTSSNLTHIPRDILHCRFGKVVFGASQTRSFHYECITAKWIAYVLWQCFIIYSCVRSILLWGVPQPLDLVC